MRFKGSATTRRFISWVPGARSLLSALGTKLATWVRRLAACPNARTQNHTLFYKKGTSVKRAFSKSRNLRISLFSSHHALFFELMHGEPTTSTSACFIRFIVRCAADKWARLRALYIVMSTARLSRLLTPIRMHVANIACAHDVNWTFSLATFLDPFYTLFST